MENIALAQQLMHINRITAENTWNALSLLQNQTIRTTHAVWEQGNRLATEGQRILNEWVEEYKRGQTAVKKKVEKNFILFKELFSTIEEAVDPKKSGKK